MERALGLAPNVLAANLRRAFSGIVAGNVKEHGIKAIEERGPFELHATETGMEVTCLHFLLTQGAEFITGTGIAGGTGAWSGKTGVANNLKAGKPARAVGQLVDYRDLTTGYTAMQRTVAFPMSIGAQMIANGAICQRGVVEPTQVPLAPFLAELRKRGLDITHKVEPWDGSLEPGGE